MDQGKGRTDFEGGGYSLENLLRARFLDGSRYLPQEFHWISKNCLLAFFHVPTLPSVQYRPMASARCDQNSVALHDDRLQFSIFPFLDQNSCSDNVPVSYKFLPMIITFVTFICISLCVFLIGHYSPSLSI